MFSSIQSLSSVQLCNAMDGKNISSSKNIELISSVWKFTKDSLYYVKIPISFLKSIFTYLKCSCQITSTIRGNHCR